MAQKSPNRIANWLSTRKTVQARQQPLQLFATQIETRSEAEWDSNDATLKQAYTFEVNTESVKTMRAANAQYVQLDILDERGEVVKLELATVQLAAPTYQLIIADEKGSNIVQSTLQSINYRGIISGDEQSIATINIDKHGTVGGIISSAKGNLVIGKIKESERYIVYNDFDLKNRPDFDCKTPDTPFTDESGKVEVRGGENNSCGKTVNLYFEADYDMYLKMEKSVEKVENHVSNLLFADVATIYANEGINIAISGLKIWSVPDPYLAATNPSDMLDMFIEKMPQFNGHLAQFLSTRSLGGGIASGFGSFCHPSERHSVSAALSTSFARYPAYTWDVSVVVHEFGHNFGSRHTHACVWGPNKNQSIDNCAGGVEGGCPQWQIPTKGIGTIMSYCHLRSDIGTNLSNGFGIEPGNVIREVVNGADCVVAASTTTALPTNLQATATPNATVRLSWQLPTGAKSAIVAYQPVGAGNNWITSGILYNQSTWTIVEGLRPNVNYQFKAKTECSAYSAVMPFVVQGACTAPTNLRVKTNIGSEMTIVWDAVANANFYELWGKRNAEASWYKVGTYTETSAKVPVTIPGQLYDFQIRTNCSDWANKLTTTTFSCSAPVLISVSPLPNTTSLAIKWSDEVTEGKTWTVQYIFGNYLYNVATVSSTSYILEGLYPNQAIQVRILSNCSTTTSNIITATIGAACQTPIDLKSITTPNGSVTLTWSPVSNATYYEVFVSNATNSFRRSIRTKESTYTLENLPKEGFYWNIRSNCSYSGENSYFSFNQCTKVTDLRASVVSNSTTVRLTWSQPSATQGAYVYIKYGTNANDRWYFYKSVYGNETLLEGLYPNQSYQFRLLLDCSAEPSNEVTVNTTSGCAAPTNLKTIVLSKTNMKLSWDAVQGASYYEIFYRIKGTTNYSYARSNANTNSQTLNGLIHGMTYEWYVRANCSWNSSTTEFYAGPTICKAPNLTSGIIANTTQVRLTWEDGTTDRKYTIQYQPTYYPASNWLNIPNITGNTYVLEDLLPYTQYNVRILSDCSGVSNTVTFTIGAGCAIPTGLQVIDANKFNFSATVAWDAVPGAQWYEVSCNVAGTFRTKNTKFTFQNLFAISAESNEYSWQVRADCSYWTAPMAFSLHRCEPVTDLKASIEPNSTSIKLSWTLPAKAITTAVYYKYPNSIWQLYGQVKGNSFVWEGISPNNMLSFRVQTECSTDPSNEVTINTGQGCNAPSSAGSSQISTSVVQLQWSAVQGATYYLLYWKPKSRTYYTSQTVAATTYRITELDFGSYDWFVRANCSNNIPLQSFTVKDVTPPGFVIYKNGQSLITDVWKNLCEVNSTASENPYEGKEHYQVNYNNLLGNIVFGLNMDNFGDSKPIDFSKYTHLRLVYRGMKAGHTLVLSLKGKGGILSDTIMLPATTAYKATNIPLKKFTKSSSIDLKLVREIMGQVISTNYDGSTLYLDAIELVNPDVAATTTNATPLDIAHTNELSKPKSPSDDINEAITPPIQLNVSVYPNPATNSINIVALSHELSLSGVSIFNNMGEMVLQNTLHTQGTGTIDVTHLPMGFYYLQIETLSGNARKKVFINK